MSKKHNSSKKEAKDLVVNSVPPSPTKVSQKLGLSTYVMPKNDGQKKAIECINTHDISFLYGVPGSGKSHLAISMGVAGMLKGNYQKIILTRPYVEAGEHLGFLPGGFNNKIAPFMYPVMEIISQQVGTEAAVEFIEKGNIQVMPLAYMRGVTFQNCYVVADEMQNATSSQMRMILTRVGEKCKLVLTGDTEQSDLVSSERNGLVDAIYRLKGMSEVGFCELSEESCVRSPLVSKIDKLYRKPK